MRTNARRFYGKELEDVLGLTAVNPQQVSLTTQELKLVPLQQLIPGKYQPRREFDPESLKELADSIAQHGILQPIIVRTTFDNCYEIIAGERRWRAAHLAELNTVPIIIYQLSDESALAVGLIENIQRKNLNPVEEALALQRLVNDFSMTHERIAKLIGRSRAMVSNSLRLLNLSEEVKTLLASNKIEMGHARSLLSLSNQKQYETAKLVVDKNLTVRETEKLVQDILGKPRLNTKSKATLPTVPHWEKLLENALATAVKIQINASGKGKLVISFDTLTEAENLVDRIRAV